MPISVCRLHCKMQTLENKTAIAFSDSDGALDFKRYLKSPWKNQDFNRGGQ